MWVNAQIIVFLTVTGNRSEGEWSDIGSSRKDASPAAQPAVATKHRDHRLTPLGLKKENSVLLHVVQNSYRANR